MKKGIKITALCLALACLLSVSVFAVDDVKKGIGTITCPVSGITVTAGEGDTGTIESVTVTDAEKLNLSYPGAINGKQYAVFLLSGTSGAPTESNIAYINQVTATASGVSFTIFPNGFQKGDYRVILTCTEDSKVGIDKPVATFKYYQAYKLGDVDDNEVINTNDAVLVLKHCAELELIEAGTSSFMAADVDKNGTLNTNDAVQILKFVAELIDTFE